MTPATLDRTAPAPRRRVHGIGVVGAVLAAVVVWVGVQRPTGDPGRGRR